MYPNGLEVNPPMEPGAIGDVLEGKARPGHFRGMLTVVERLLSITHANYSFFGEKDFQQLTLVKAMVAASRLSGSGALINSPKNRFLETPISSG